MKKYLPLIVLCLSLLFLAWAFVFKNHLGSGENIAPEEIIEFLTTETPNPSANVPTFAPTDLIKLFFSHLNEHQPLEALALMSQALQGDENNRAPWFKQFAAGRWANVEELTLITEDEIGERQQYRVAINIDLVADDQAPLPFYGWGDNPNWRWISVEKNSAGQWAISEIATGP